MKLFAILFFEVGLVIGTVLLIEFLVLLFRNPHRPKWLRYEFAETSAALVLVASSCFSFAAFMTGMLEAGLHVFAALPLAVVLPLAVAFASARAIGFRERLRRADAGETPFRALGEKPRVLPAAQSWGQS